GHGNCANGGRRPFPLTFGRPVRSFVTLRRDLGAGSLDQRTAKAAGARCRCVVVAMRIRTALSKARARLGREGGYTLVELVIVMLILGLVMTPLVASFTTGMVQEVDQVRREQAYANARLALQRMRVDIHCATGLAQVEQNAYGGFTMTLAEPSTDAGLTQGSPRVTPPGPGSSGV